MNIFIIPSWYPSQRNNLAGIFIKEQIVALGETFPQDKFIVSTWGQDDAEIPTRKPWELFSIISWRIRHSAEYYYHREDCHHEFFSPSISWSARLPLGGAMQTFSAHRQNLKAALKKFGHIDLLHCHVSYPAGFIGHKLSREFGIPYLITEHMGPFPFSHLMKNGHPISKVTNAFREASAAIAVSPFLQSEIKRLGCGETVVIPNLVNESVFFPTFQPRTQPEDFIFFSLSTQSVNKGIDTLLYAIKEWREKPKNVLFFIGGDGPELPTYIALASKLGIQDSIQWLGKVPRTEAPTLFNKCDAFVLPSRYETFGVVFAEALACGKPIIATQCGGPEFIVNDSNGLIVPIDHPKILATAMQKIYCTRSQYSTQLIRQDFLKRFSRSAVTQQIHKVYEDILGNHSFLPQQS